MSGPKDWVIFSRETLINPFPHITGVTKDNFRLHSLKWGSWALGKISHALRKSDCFQPKSGTGRPINLICNDLAGPIKVISLGSAKMIVPLRTSVLNIRWSGWYSEGARKQTQWSKWQGKWIPFQKKIWDAYFYWQQAGQISQDGWRWGDCPILVSDLAERARDRARCDYRISTEAKYPAGRFKRTLLNMVCNMLLKSKRVPKCFDRSFIHSISYCNRVIRESCERDFKTYEAMYGKHQHRSFAIVRMQVVHIQVGTQLLREDTWKDGQEDLCEIL